VGFDSFVDVSMVKIRSNRYSLLLCVLVLLAIQPMMALAKTLEIGIEHTEVFPSVSQDLRPGRRFSLSAAEMETPSDEWILLPEWMSGTWRLGQETSVLRHDFKKNKTENAPFKYNARHDFQYGMQMDRNGGIWHYIGTPYHSKTSLSNFDEIHLVRSKRFHQSDQSGISFTTAMTVVRVEMGNVITESFQQESITSYAPGLEPGFIQMSASTKSFDAAGQPWRQSDNVAKIKKIKPFAELKTYHGRDMRESFRTYLIANGKSNLLPD